MRSRLRSLATVTLCALATVSPAVAQPNPPKVVKAPPPAPLVGLTKLGELRPSTGFVDDEITPLDHGVVALVRDGAAVKAVTLGADAAITATIELSKLAPAAIRITPLADRAWFVLEAIDAGQRAVVVAPDGKKLRAHKLGTALASRLIGGKAAVITYVKDAKAKGGEAHTIAMVDARTGKKLPGKPTRLVLAGPERRDAKLDFRPVYFLDDMTVAVGVRGGIWRKADNQRGPDTWAALDLTSGRWLKDDPITDPMDLARRIPILESYSNQRTFARMADDLSTVEVWRDGRPHPITLDQPVDVYDPVSIQYALHGETLWLSLVVDPTNPSAVKRQKADPRYLDLFEVRDGAAVRRARILVDKVAPRWGWSGDLLWVLERHPVLGRGGAALGLFRL